MNRFAHLLVAGVCALTLVGCGTRDDAMAVDGDGQVDGGQTDGAPDLGGANGTLSVRVVGTPQRLLTGSPDTATLTAYVVDADNRAIAAQPVSFSASAGVLQGVSTETDDNGVASATLSLLDDYRTQAVTVTVDAGEFTGTGIVRADGSGFAIDAPDEIVAGAEAALVATLSNGAGEPIAGTEVTFASDAGNAITPATAVTGADGRVEASVSSDAGDDTITLSALEGTVSAVHALDVVVEGEPGPTDSTLDVRVQSAPRLLSTGGNARASITAYVVDLDNEAVAGHPVSFSASAGVLQAASTETDDNGVATATLALLDDFRVRDVTVTVTAGDFVGEALVHVDGTVFEIDGPGKVADGETATLDVTLQSGSGEGIGGERVTVTSSAGNTITPTAVTTDGAGRFSLAIDSAAGDDTITMSALEGSVSVTHSLDVVAGGDATGTTFDVRVQGTPQRLLTGATETSAITAYVVDLDNRAVTGQAVSFSSSAGVLQGVSDETDENGVARATLALLDDKRLQDVTVTATAGEFEGQAVVRAVGSDFVVEGAGKIPAGTDAELVVTLTDGAGEPIAGETVTLASAAGNAITPSTATTDANGSIAVRVASENGDDTITMSALEGTVTATHAIEVLTDTLEFDGIDADTRLRVGPENPVAVIWKSRGTPVADRALRFTTSLGRIIGGTLVNTDSDGRAEVMLTSDVSGETTITAADAADGEPSAEVTLQFLPALEVRVLSDANRIETGGSDVANISALVTDADNKAVAGQPVSFSASGGVLQGVSTETDANGVARATLRLLQDFRTQDITVSVTADDAAGDAVVSADGSELEVGGPTNLIEGASAEIIAVLKAGNGEPIVNETVTVTSERDNTITPAELVTDIDGRIAFSVGSANGNDTVRLSALEGTVTASHSFSVSTQTLAFEGIDIDTELDVVDPNSVTVTWTSAGVPVVGETLRFGTTAGIVDGSPTAVTDAAGQATFTLRSSSAGPARLTVEDAADGEPSTYVDVEFVAGAAAAIEIGASSTRVPVRGTSTITARVTDANGNPVKGKEVVFGSDDLKGGQLNPASATTAQDGEASVTFTAGDRPTEFDVGAGADDIVLSATVEGVTLAPTDERNRMSLSVVERALNVTLGTANKVVSEGDGPVQYWLNFVVQVADGGGTPVDGADVSLSIRPLQYAKGRLTETDESGVAAPETNDPWTHEAYRQRDFIFPLDDLGNPLAPVQRIATCDTEDENRNRVLDPGEDFNDNGLLDPQDPASLVASTDGRATLSGGTLSTDATGSGYLRLIYPVTNAQWAYVEITALARGLGVEAKDTFRTDLPMLSAELNQSDSTPPNYFSPYGTDPDCSNVD